MNGRIDWLKVMLVLAAHEAQAPALLVLNPQATPSDLLNDVALLERDQLIGLGIRSFANIHSVEDPPKGGAWRKNWVQISLSIDETHGPAFPVLNPVTVTSNLLNDGSRLHVGEIVRLNVCLLSDAEFLFHSP